MKKTNDGSYIDAGEDDESIALNCNGKSQDSDDDDDDVAIDDYDIDNTDNKIVYEGKEDKIAILDVATDQKNKQNSKTKLKQKMPSIRRRKTIDTINKTSVPITSFISNNKIVIDYNALAFIENIALESDEKMENRMIKFIGNLKNNYINVQYVEYKTNNKLYCALDIIYGLPILLNLFENKEPHGKPRASSPPPPPQRQPTKKKLVNKPATNNNNNDRNIRLYTIGSDFYLMCRKKENFVDGYNNIEKRYGKCKLIKVWNNSTDVKSIGKLVIKKFPYMKWNARTNILTNSLNKPVSEQDLLNHLEKVSSLIK